MVEKAKRYLSRQDILAADDLPVAEMEVPEWGGWLRIKSLSAAERDWYEASMVEQSGKRGQRMNLLQARAKLCALAIVDDEGKPLFTMRDLEALGAKSAAVLNRVWEKARSMAGMSDDDVEELEKNLLSGPSDGSASG